MRRQPGGRSGEDLLSELRHIDGRGYKAYKSIRDTYILDRDLTLFIDHVQGDPFAAPSRLRVRVAASAAAFPGWSIASASRRTALADFLTRAFAAALGRRSWRPRGHGKSGLIRIEEPAQEVLPRTSVVLDDSFIEARFRLGLPARGRRVMGREAADLLLEEVPAIARASLSFAALDEAALRAHVEAIEDQQALRAALSERGLVAFVGNGARLPRASGVDPRPLQGRVVAFEAPASLEVEIAAPNRGAVRGMGIPVGVTLIVGGGYHGKSTLVNAIELGVYDHVPGDGRELVVTRDDAVKIRAEDGRRVERVGIDPFIADLPFGRDTRAFSTEDASGSTSQAANIIEALEVGARVLLMDEDTSATNFLIRDHRMQALVAKDKEPITPFIDKVHQLADERGVSSILVIGGSGDYFDVADTVVMMDEYLPRDASAEAKRIAAEYRELRRPEGGERFGEIRPRRPKPDSLDPSRGKREVKVDVRERREIGFGTYQIDLTALEQLVEPAQTRAIAHALLYLRECGFDGRTTLAEALSELEARLARDGIDVLTPGRGEIAYARRFEIAGALNRLRSLRVDS